MDYRKDWFIYNNKLLNDLKTEKAEFGISIELGLAPEGSPPNSPIYIPVGGIAFRVTIFDRVFNGRTELIFASFDDIMFFLRFYAYKCSNLVEINRAYAGFCMSEDALVNKGYEQ